MPCRRIHRFWAQVSTCKDTRGWLGLAVSNTITARGLRIASPAGSSYTCHLCAAGWKEWACRAGGVEREVGWKGGVLIGAGGLKLSPDGSNRQIHSRGTWQPTGLPPRSSRTEELHTHTAQCTFPFSKCIHPGKAPEPLNGLKLQYRYTCSNNQLSVVSGNPALVTEIWPLFNLYLPGLGRLSPFGLLQTHPALYSLGYIITFRSFSVKLHWSNVGH